MGAAGAVGIEAFEFREEGEKADVDGAGGGAADLLEDDGAGERAEGPGRIGGHFERADQVDDAGHGGVGGAKVAKSGGVFQRVGGHEGRVAEFGWVRTS